uniref:Uncharacterized protein n=1 Tax=Ascaris lumbricoides TaxID=6252 RepID=A0A9J2PYX9_ASCLU
MSYSHRYFLGATELKRSKAAAFLLILYDGSSHFFQRVSPANSLLRRLDIWSESFFRYIKGNFRDRFIRDVRICDECTIMFRIICTNFNATVLSSTTNHYCTFTFNFLVEFIVNAFTFCQSISAALYFYVKIIFRLGSHVISDVLRYEVATYWHKSRKAPLGCISMRTLHISSVPIRVLTFLAYQTGVIRAASLIAQITMIQECFETPMILLIVNLPSTLLGMIALNLLRKALASSALAICQVAMFIFTMQYSCFELVSAAHQLHNPTRFSFEYAMFLYRALTIFELLTILLVITLLLRKKKSTTIIHPEARLRS